MKRLILVLCLLAPPVHAADLPCYDGQPVARLVRLRPPTDLGSGVTGYRLYRGLASGIYDVAPLELAVESDAAQGVLRGVGGTFDPTLRWYVAVSAFGPGGEGPKSNELVIEPSGRVCAAPGRPELLEILRQIEGAGARLRRALELPLK